MTNSARHLIPAFLVANRAQHVKYQFLNDTGKPYSEPNLGQIHYKLYLEFLNKLKVKAYRGFINRDISAQPAVKPFIV